MDGAATITLLLSPLEDSLVELAIDDDEEVDEGIAKKQASIARMVCVFPLPGGPCTSSRGEEEGGGGGGGAEVIDEEDGGCVAVAVVVCVSSVAAVVVSPPMLAVVTCWIATGVQEALVVAEVPLFSLAGGR